MAVPRVQGEGEGMSAVKGKSVFLSGPMSGIEHFNVGEFAKAHAMLREAGAYKVYNPAIAYLTSPVREDTLDHTYWMLRCIRELTDTSHNILNDALGLVRTYQVLVSLPGWESSEGARTERMVATACGIECFDLEEVV